MTQRFDLSGTAPDGYKAMLGVHGYVNGSGLSAALLELVRMRVSQINGCAFCLAMHIPIALQHGVSPDQVNLVAVWREAPIFDEPTRSALAWAEAVTKLAGGDVPDEVYALVKTHFSVREIADLTFAIAEINAWNRLAIASRTPPQLSGR